jgi:hypothetical protein
MRGHQQRPISDDENFAREAPSNEVLMLKIGDLFQEVERLKQRIELLETRVDRGRSSNARDPRPAEGVMSDSDW